jgi:hydrogenase maturation protease
MSENAPAPQTGQKLVVIGIGNEFRGDDGVGIYAARKLKEMKLAGVLVEALSGEGLALFEAFKDLQNVILIDAVQSGADSGTIYSFDVGERPLPKTLFRNSSTHDFGVVDAIELARAMGQLPQKLIVYGIEGVSFAQADALTPSVKNAAEEVILQIAKELS